MNKPLSFAFGIFFIAAALPAVSGADVACALAQQALNCPQWSAFQNSPEADTFVDFNCYANVCSSVTQQVISSGSHDNVAALCECDNIATDNGRDGARLSCVQSSVMSFCASGY